MPAASWRQPRASASMPRLARNGTASSIVQSPTISRARAARAGSLCARATFLASQASAAGAQSSATRPAVPSSTVRLRRMADSGIVDIAGARIAWWADGAGPEVVLVHAGVADARMWAPLLPALSQAHRVVRYDMRGFGRTRTAAGTFSHPRDLAGLLDALGIARAHIVGASFGGLVALELAATEPARVASLVLLAPPLPDMEPSPELQALADAEEQAIEEGRIDDAVAVNVETWAGRSAQDVRALVADMQRAAFELQLREGAVDLELAPPVSERLAAVDMPTTLAVGDRDVADFVGVAERLERELPHAALHRIAGAGHLLALDVPNVVAQLVVDHVAGAVSSRASPPR